MPSPACSRDVPNDSTTTSSPKPALASNARATASAIGDRQMLPWQTMAMRIAPLCQVITGAWHGMLSGSAATVQVTPIEERIHP